MTENNRAVVVTVDAGSGSCRALAWDQSGRMLGLSQQEWDYKPSGHPGGMDFPTESGWRRATECIRAALSQAGVGPEDVKAVTATSMREGFVVYDEGGQEIWAVPNVDARAQKEAEDIIREGLAEPIYRRGGDWTSIAASARLRWIKDNAPEIWERARHMTMLGDWVLQKLSGEYVTDPSLGSSSGLFDLATRDWSKETAEELEISHLLPRVAESGTVVGSVSKRAAEETGLKEGTPVVAGGADTQLGLLGGGVVEANRFGVVGGTFWLTAGIADTPLVDPDIRLRTLCHVVPDRWMIEGVGFVHGLSTRYVRDGLLRAANPSFTEGDGYKKLDELAGQCPPGANGVSYFASNVMNAKSWKHAPPSIVGISPFTIAETGLGAIFRAALEEAVYGARGHMEILEEIYGRKVEEVTFVGGPSKSRLWSQILSDVLDARVQVPDVLEATCLGAALCALVGAGAYSDLAEAAGATVHTASEYEPNADAVAAYDDLYPRWRALNDHMIGAADKGLAPYMWTGAGAASPDSEAELAEEATPSDMSR
jgi:autoinducer 2 (AI-2) kinase